jgi:putative transposase
MYILYAVFFYVRYGVSYCDLEEIMGERGVSIDHATLSRRVIDYAPLSAVAAKKRKRAIALSWRMVIYWYRAVDKFGDTP